MEKDTVMAGGIDPALPLSLLYRHVFILEVTSWFKVAAGPSAIPYMLHTGER